MNDDDKKLDALLADIEVPPDLKDQLRRIPQNDVQRSEVVAKDQSLAKRSHYNGRRLGLLAIAAGLTGIAAYFAWPQPKARIADSDQIEILESTQNQMQTRWEQIDELFDQVEIERLTSLVENTRGRQTLALLPDREIQAFVVSMSDQSAVYHGASVESVRADMSRVIAQYPGTHGARIAKQFLSDNAPVTQ